MFKSIQTGRFFIDPCRLIHREGPVYERPFCSMLVFQKGTLSFEKLFLILFCNEERTHKLDLNNKDRR